MKRLPGERPARLRAPAEGDAVERYLAALRQELAARGLSRAPFAARLMEETEDHLRERSAALRAAGHPRGAAESTAVVRMGRPVDLVLTWESEVAAAPADRRPSRRLLRALGGTLMHAVEARNRWWRTGFWSTLGLLAGGLLAIPAGHVAGLATMMLILPAIGGAVGLGLGLAQRHATRGRGVLSGRWWLASTLGMAVGLSGGTALIEQLDLSKGLWSHDLGALALIGGAAGFTLSLAQVWALRAGPRLRASWVVGSALAMALALVLGGAVAYGFLGGIRQFAGLAVIAAVASVTVGVSTACLLETVARRSGVPAV